MVMSSTNVLNPNLIDYLQTGHHLQCSVEHLRTVSLMLDVVTNNEHFFHIMVSVLLYQTRLLTSTRFITGCILSPNQRMPLKIHYKLSCYVRGTPSLGS